MKTEELIQRINNVFEANNINHSAGFSVSISQIKNTLGINISVNEFGNNFEEEIFGENFSIWGKYQLKYKIFYSKDTNFTEIVKAIRRNNAYFHDAAKGGPRSGTIVGLPEFIDSYIENDEIQKYGIYCSLEKPKDSKHYSSCSSEEERLYSDEEKNSYVYTRGDRYFLFGRVFNKICQELEGILGKKVSYEFENIHSSMVYIIISK